MVLSCEHSPQGLAHIPFLELHGGHLLRDEAESLLRAGKLIRLSQERVEGLAGALDARIGRHRECCHQQEPLEAASLRSSRLFWHAAQSALQLPIQTRNANHCNLGCVEA